MAIWTEYYKQFGIKSDSIRPDCEPRVMLQGSPTEKAIILIHGLTDSPYFMRAIGEYFYKWGYNVFIPLLDGHGLKNPNFMKNVKLETWIKNVDFAIKEAKEKHQCRKISIGGLSTGGALSVLKMFDAPYEITGGVFLFSAALDIAGALGDIKEKLLKTLIVLPILAEIEDRRGKNLIGDNPYRYSRMDKDGAKELSILIDQIDEYLKKAKQGDIRKPIFVAHSECDTAADIQGVEELIKKSDPNLTEFFRIKDKLQVSHASVVLKEDVIAENGSILESKNPLFEEMMNVVEKFQSRIP